MSVVMVYQSVDNKHSVMAKINEVVDVLMKNDKTGLRSNSQAKYQSIHHARANKFRFRFCRMRVPRSKMTHTKCINNVSMLAPQMHRL